MTSLRVKLNGGDTFQSRTFLSGFPLYAVVYNDEEMAAEWRDYRRQTVGGRHIHKMSYRLLSSRKSTRPTHSACKFR